MTVTIKRGLVTYRIMTVLLLCFFSSSQSFAGLIVDTLEDIGPDGTPVASRSLSGITIGIATTGAAQMAAFTYNVANPKAFDGAGGSSNVPLNPGNVSGSRFIAGLDSGIEFDQPIVFTFSEGVLGFGLTTLDLLEGPGGLPSFFVALEARDAQGTVLDIQTRTGNQGPGGLDLDWFVSSPTANITEARLVSNIPCTFGCGYGIDDLVLDTQDSTVPEPSALLLIIAGVSFFALGRNSNNRTG